MQKYRSDKMDRKGVSPVVAIVLLIMIVIIIGLIVYVYATNQVHEYVDTVSEVGNHKFLVESTNMNNVTIRNMGKEIDFNGNTEADFLEIFDVYVNIVLYPPGAVDSFTTEDGDTIWSNSELLIINFNESNIRKGDRILLVHKETGTLISLVIK